jgi:hypothetical protein
MDIAEKRNECISDYQTILEKLIEEKIIKIHA